jgi:ABC-type uncharacterized transport system substrate-binding protein
MVAVVLLAEPRTEQIRSPAAHDALNSAAAGLNVELHDVEVKTPADLVLAFRNAKEQGVKALYVWTTADDICSR